MPVALAILCAVVVGTWNGSWFPSGRAEHRAHPDVEAATVRAAGRMLADAIAQADPAGTNDVVFCLNEMRGPRVVSNLLAQIDRPGLRLAAISAYRRRDRFDMQQDAILTTLPVVTNGWFAWKPRRREKPPRGCAFAVLVFDPATTATVYAVHFKSNYGSSRPEIAVLNRLKRGHAAEELSARLGSGPAIVLGDFNADRWRAEFADETLFALFDRAGFRSSLSALPEGRRGTYPNAKYGDSALDDIYLRGFSPVSKPQIVPCEGLSDHRALVVSVEP